MDGVQATEIIRNSDGPSSTQPIVALTANVLAEDRAKFLGVGMNDIISKPVSFDRLMTVVGDARPQTPTPSTADEAPDPKEMTPDRQAQGSEIT